jgi:hypothetical protein
MQAVCHVCPICEQLTTEEDGAFVCADHGTWYLYGASLLVRAPSVAAREPERPAMPWEVLAPAT